MTLSLSEEGYLVQARALNEFVYCPRLFHLMYVQGLFEDSLETVDGRIAHTKRLNRSKAATAQNMGETPSLPWPVDQIREFSLSSTALRIIGKFDVIVGEKGEVVPVEVKRGPAPEGTSPFVIGGYQLEAAAWANDQVQLAAQIALLDQAGHRCAKGRLYYQQTGTLVELGFSGNLSAALEWAINQAQKLVNEPMPEPLVDSNKCIRCSLNYVCLPDETQHMKGILKEPRQLYPGRDDCGVLHIVTPGTHLGKSGETARICAPGEREVLIPMKDISSVCCWGNAQISTQTVLELADRGVGITWLTGGGWIRATTTALLEKNVRLRREQYRACDDQAMRLHLARWIVAAKIENQRVILRRNEKDQSLQHVLAILRDSRQRATKASTIDSLRGIEGYAARVYWESFPSLFTERAEPLLMNGRNRRPPKDPVNTLLSFGYAMLLRDFMTVLHTVGLDPMYGFYHALVAGRPALALDLMEAFRPLVVDSAVLRAINEASFVRADFVQMKGCCTLKPAAKKRWISAYERRVDEMVTHPVFGYRLSYRRIFMLEARLFGRFISGEFADYHPLTTR